MASYGVGWNGIGADVVADLTPLADLAGAGNLDGLVDRLNLLLFGGRMGAELRQTILEAMGSVQGNTPASHTNRARVALFLALASPDYLVQR
jgi:hypothetical protein